MCPLATIPDSAAVKHFHHCRSSVEQSCYKGCTKCLIFLLHEYMPKNKQKNVTSRK